MMQQKPAEAMEVCARAVEEEAVAPKAVGPGPGFWAAARRRLSPDDPFFAAGDMQRELLAKHVALDLSEDDRYQLEKMEVGSANTLFCPIAGCGAHLDCLENFEDHYSTRHTASCCVCSSVSNFKYECLVEGCGVKLKSYKSRQQHLVDKHQFPKSFEFFKRAHPSQRQRQKYHQKQTACKGEDKRDTLLDVDGKSPRLTNWSHRRKQQHHTDSKENEHHKKVAKENEMEVEQKIGELTLAVSRLSTADSTPSSIPFSHRRSHGLTFVPRSIRQNKQVSQPEAK